MPTVAEYLIEKIKPLADTVFGIPGDYVLNFYHQLNDKLQVVNSTDEQCAGFAADAYARVRGFGVVCATYCVGGFKLVNPVAGAYAEKSPLLFISGAPGVKERSNGLLLHHAAGPYESQYKVFKNITCASVVLDDPIWAVHEIDRVIDAILYYKQPGYIELPRDMVGRYVSPAVLGQGRAKIANCDKDNLAEALQFSLEFVKNAEKPVILAGVEVARFGFGAALMDFAKNNGIPVATTILGKSVVNESDHMSLGVYAGRMSKDEVRDAVEGSDCVLMLGAMQTDMNFGFQPFECHSGNVILANTGRVKIRRSTYENVDFTDFMSGLLKSNVRPKAAYNNKLKQREPFTVKSGSRITVQRMFEKIDSLLNEELAVIADVGDSMFGAVDLTIHHQNQFLAPAFYTSMGSSIPGALGMQMANRNVRPIVVVGDGAFQMTGMELATIVKRGLNPIVFVINNGGYSTERCLGFDGTYNDVANWAYHEIPKIINGGTGYLIQTEDELESAVNSAMSDKKSLSILNVMIDKMDVTNALRRMTQRLSEHV